MYQRTQLMVLHVFIVSLCFILGSTYALASVSAYLDRNPVGLDSSFILNFEVIGDAATPDFEPIRQDFSILNQQKSSNISIVNGSFSRKQQWQLNLMPKSIGHFVIPPISFGQQSSQQISIDVVEEQSHSASNRDIFIEVSLNNLKPYVQQQVLMHVKLYRAVNIGKATLSDPEHDNFIVKKLGEDRHGEVDMNSRRYLLVERTYALFPQQSGNMTLAPISFEGQVMQYNGQLQTRRIRSSALTLQVQAMPKHVLEDWLPVQKLEISEAWPDSMPELKVGQALTRTIELRAQGASSAQLPEIMLPASDAIKIYPDKAKLEDEVNAHGILGTRIQSIALVASKAGTVQLPAIEIPWWNTQTQKMEIARLPQRSIHIQAVRNPVVSTPTPEHKQVTPQNSSERHKQENSTTPLWMYSTIGIFLLWLMTLALWWKSVRSTQTTRPSNNKKDSLKRLKQACDQQDSQACSQALLAWAKQIAPQHNIHHLGALQDYLDADAKRSIHELEAVLFSGKNLTWDAQALYQNINKAVLCPVSKEEHSYPVKTL